MEHFMKFLSYLLVCALLVCLCAWSVDAASPAASSADLAAAFSYRGKELSLCEAEEEYLIYAVAFESRGTDRVAGKAFRGESAPYAARIGMIATIFNRMIDPRFPDSAARVIAADRTFSDSAVGDALSERELDLTRAALRCAMDGFDPTEGALYFSTPRRWVNRFDVTCTIGAYHFGSPPA